ncbi:MAG: hypothetical protein HYS23_05035 [Geobacter sp.]|nr:hypothetical protein [Geobacter sp.]
MKRRIVTTLLCGMSTILFAGACLAGTNDPRIQRREQNQERRIDQGVESGALTPKETGRLEAEQAKIKQDEERMKADGNLTRKERAKLTREQNRASRDVYRQKHNRRRQ